MALFGDKPDFAAMARLEAQNELLTVENEKLHKQVERLQGAIVSKLAPLAYAEMRAEDTADENPEMDEQARKEFDEEIQLYKDYAAAIEKPFWTDPDDMLDQLGAALGAPNPVSTSLHGNEES